jgi:hypothetical protein
MAESARGVFPSGIRWKVQEDDDRRLRVVFHKVGPASIEQFYGQGEGKDVILVVKPK